LEIAAKLLPIDAKTASHNNYKTSAAVIQQIVSQCFKGSAMENTLSHLQLSLAVVAQCNMAAAWSSGLWNAWHHQSLCKFIAWLP
jgi:hypothetical protein